MTRTLWLAVLIMLTQLDGHPVWIESSSIIIIKPAHTGQNPARQCSGSAGAAIRVDGLGLCVKETAEEIKERIKNAK